MSKPSRKRKNPDYTPEMAYRDHLRMRFRREIEPQIAAGKAPPGTYRWDNEHGWEYLGPA